ncbi:hypothetical protein BH11PAT4_BH11PAT4_7280 [soil metagenome]
MQTLSKLQRQLLAAVFTNRSVHGYELLKSSNAATSSVYEALRVLSARGLVEKRQVARDNAPTAILYITTQEGRKVLVNGDPALEVQITSLRQKYLSALRLRA